MFTNLLINAQQSIPHSNIVSIRTKNIFELANHTQHTLQIEADTYVHISITDHRIGIPREHMPRIFDPYFNTKHHNSDLNLTTTYSIVKNHGGLIGVESKPGVGTTMEVSLPAAAMTHQREDRALVVAGGAGRPRVLVMDDEASVRTLAANMLEFLGYDAEIVDTGSAAVERFRRALSSSNPFHAVMLDLVVPGEMGAREHAAGGRRGHGAW